MTFSLFSVLRAFSGLEFSLSFMPEVTESTALLRGVRQPTCKTGVELLSNWLSLRADLSEGARADGTKVSWWEKQYPQLQYPQRTWPGGFSRTGVNKH